MDLNECRNFSFGDHYLGDLSSDRRLTIIVQKVSDFERLCDFDAQAVRVLSEGVHQKFNITLRILAKGINQFFYMGNNPEVDMIMPQLPIEDYSNWITTVQWHWDQYNLVILSGTYEKPAQTNLLNIYSKVIWFLLLFSIIVVSICIELRKIVKAQFVDNQSQKFSISQTIFEVFRYLLNQSMNKKSNDYWVFNLWSFMSLIITITFAGGVLSSIVNKEYLPINSIQELINSDKTLITTNESWIWWKYNAKNQFGMKIPDQLLLALEPRLKTVTNEVFEDRVIFKRIANREIVLVTGLSYALEMKHTNPEFNLDLGKDMDYYTLVGYPINRNSTKTRIKLYKIIEIMVESGLNIRSQSRVETKHKLFGNRLKQIDGKNGDELRDWKTIQLDFILKLFVQFSVSYAIGIALVIIEIILQNNCSQ